MRMHLNRGPVAGECVSLLLKISDINIAKTEDGKVVHPPGLASVVVSFKELRSKLYPNIRKLCESLMINW